jgi:REP element-mobilizing transposase RayT
MEQPMPLRRRTPRLKGFDYSQAGAYFVTICAQDRLPLFGRVLEGSMVLSLPGQMVQQVWSEMPQYYAGVELDAFVVMPDHLHGILALTGERRGFSLPDAMQRFKSLTTARYRHGVASHGWPPFRGRLWQRSYHDQIVRDDMALSAIRNYIAQNPLRWSLVQGQAASDR